MFMAILMEEKRTKETSRRKTLRISGTVHSRNQSPKSHHLSKYLSRLTSLKDLTLIGLKKLDYWVFFELYVEITYFIFLIHNR